MKQFILVPALALFLGFGHVQAAEEGGNQRGGDNAGQQEGRRGGGEEGRRGRGNWMERVVRDNPELEGVDLQSEEGQAKLREVMSKRMQERMQERRTEQRDALKQELGFSEDEYLVIQPLLDRVETLRLQEGFVAPNRLNGGNRNDRGNRRGGFGNMDMTSALLGGQEMDPLATEVKEAATALHTLLEDPQVNEDELTAALARLQKARKALTAEIEKACSELRTVLTVKQEALLTKNGMLE